MKPYYEDDHVTLWHGDCLDVLANLPAASVDCCVTSPPYYGLRDYGAARQHGLEASPAEYVATMVGVFREVRRVLADDGTLWVNLGDSYSGSWGAQGVTGGLRKRGVVDARAYAPSSTRTGAIRPGHPPAKNMLGMPWRVAFALQDDGWTLRNDIIWAKPNAMPESVTDRLSTKHEHLFLFAKSRNYWFDLNPIREAHADASIQRAQPHRAAAGLAARDGKPYAGIASALDQANHPSGRNPGDVWTIPTRPFAEAHFAVMAPELARRAIVAGCKPGGTVLDPYSGSGTTGQQAIRHGRRYVGIDVNADYLDISLRTRFAETPLDFTETA